MSRARPTGSSKANKPVPTSWRDRLEPEDYQELKNTFQVFDEDGSGTIDPVEINKVLEELGIDRRNPLVFGIIERLKELNKPIKLEEFIDIAASSIGEVKTKDGVRRVFGLLDRNEDGLIDFEEFKAGLKSIGDQMNDEAILEMMHSTFINKKTSSNEAFTFDEFYQIVSQHKSQR